MNNDSVKVRGAEIVGMLFPDNVSGVIQPIGDYQSFLHPDEYKIVETASEKRKFEFSTGRWCAKQALAALHTSDTIILSGNNREPVWPEGFIGSISHCKDYCGAVVTNSPAIKSIGFDVEPIKQLKNDITRVICTEEEKQWLKSQKNPSYEVLAILIFSLKESVYKCVFQHLHKKLGFKDITILPALESGSAEILLNRDLNLPDIMLKFVVNRNHIYSGATLY